MGKKRRPRPTFEDILRALAYLGFAVWAALFLVFPPVAYLDALDVATRAFWMVVTGVGALMATVGVLLRWDLKGEFPGLIFMLIGPIFYFVAQIYYVIDPLPGADPHARISFSIYAILPVLLILPRLYALYMESRRLKKINSQRGKLTPEQAAQPGAFEINVNRGE